MTNAFHKAEKSADIDFADALSLSEQYAGIVFQRHYIELVEYCLPTPSGEEEVLFVLNDKRIAKNSCAIEISEAQEAEAEFENCYVYRNMRDAMEAVIARTAEVGIELSSNYKGW